eukprot:gnl/MRDRNA2_/MRDRNA2_75423_c0_seq1.p1 gnl/MRDRNA2_/MRDRNA2_75423_c0~~gnl/MRDRNA2_/MRDRNA2_75423_c0_seq1.p1  ORF type:complete len:444 (+),score=57.32 gnl/MRDRNA2_/MRDRNA2_75423_c0_seq1:100-1431(+)
MQGYRSKLTPLRALPRANLPVSRDGSPKIVSEEFTIPEGLAQRGSGGRLTHKCRSRDGSPKILSEEFTIPDRLAQRSSVDKCLSRDRSPKLFSEEFIIPERLPRRSSSGRRMDNFNSRDGSPKISSVEFTTDKCCSRDGSPRILPEELTIPERLAWHSSGGRRVDESPRSDFGEDKPFEMPPEELTKERLMQHDGSRQRSWSCCGSPRSDCGSRRGFKASSESAFSPKQCHSSQSFRRVDTSLPAMSRPRRHSTSGFLESGSPSHVRRPSIGLNYSASEGALLPLPPLKKQEKRDSDPVYLTHCPSLETRNFDKVLREDFYAVFDVYQALYNGKQISNAQYKAPQQSDAGRRAMQIVHTLMARRVRSASPSAVTECESKSTIPPLMEFIRQVWPRLSQSEEQVLRLWATQREGQTYAKYRLIKPSSSVGKGFSNDSLPNSFFK